MTPAEIINDKLRMTLTVGEWVVVLRDMQNMEIACKLESYLRLHVNKKVDRFRDKLLADILCDGSEDDTQDIMLPADMKLPIAEDTALIEDVALEEDPQLNISKSGLQWTDTCAMGIVCALFLTFVRIGLM